MNKKYSKFFLWGATAVLAFITCILIFFVLYRFNEVKTFIKTLSGILTPILIGLVIAYLVTPIVNFFNRQLYKLFQKWHISERAAKSTAKGISIFLALLLFVSIILAIIYLIIPQLAKNITGFISNLETYFTNLYNWFSRFIDDKPELLASIYQIMEKVTTFLETWTTTTLPMQVKDLLSSVTIGIIGAVRLVFDIIIGLIVSIYVLVSKERFTGQMKKIIYVLFRPQLANAILRTARQSNFIFSGFISGKIIDSLIIGILCFIGLTLLKTPYALLVSVIVGVTNVIPFFGPFIGAIPSAVLILLVDPKQCLIFLIFVLFLQQLDGNIIGPTILGDSTGLSAFWVVVSILVGGGLFGFIGMVIGVPTFAVFYNIIKNLVEYFLSKKNMPTKTADYCELSFIEPTTLEPVYNLEETLKTAKKEARKKERKKKKAVADTASENPAVSDTKVPIKNICETKKKNTD